MDYSSHRLWLLGALALAITSACPNFIPGLTCQKPEDCNGAECIEGLCVLPCRLDASDCPPGYCCSQGHCGVCASALDAGLPDATGPGLDASLASSDAAGHDAALDAPRDATVVAAPDAAAAGSDAAAAGLDAAAAAPDASVVASHDAAVARDDASAAGLDASAAGLDASGGSDGAGWFDAGGVGKPDASTYCGLLNLPCCAAGTCSEGLCAVGRCTNFGGAFVRDESVSSDIQCTTPNPLTGQCNCPGSFPWTQIEIYRDQAVPATIIEGYLCVAPVPSGYEGFGGAFETSVSGGACTDPNPLATGCTCPGASIGRSFGCESPNAYSQTALNLCDAVSTPSPTYGGEFSTLKQNPRMNDFACPTGFGSIVQMPFFCETLSLCIKGP